MNTDLIIWGYSSEEWFKSPNYNKYYSQSIYCGNCSKHDSIYILKGKLKSTIWDVKCRNCECSIVKL